MEKFEIEFKNPWNVCHMVVILIFSTRTKKALNALPIKGDSDLNRQSQRMLLFRSARNALRVCMKIISVTPLDKIWRVCSIHV